MIASKDLLNDSLDDLIGAPLKTAPAPLAHKAPAPQQLFAEPCRKCGGTGMWRGRGRCFTCNGKGKVEFKTSAATRERAKDNAAARKAKTEQSALEAFQAEHPAVWTWMDGSTFPFAVSLRDAIAKFGSLTANQLAAAYRCVEKLEAAKVAGTERRAAAPSIDVAPIVAAFECATAARVKKMPRLVFDGLIFSKAKPDSANPGAIYVKGAEYLGKITSGKFFAARACTPEQQARVLEIAADPKTAAIAYGKKFGVCCVCNRTLTDPASIQNGIGPICAVGMGW